VPWQEVIALVAVAFFASVGAYLLVRNRDVRLVMLQVLGARACGVAARAIDKGDHNAFWYVPTFLVVVTWLTVSFDRTLRLTSNQAREDD
jgi:hypothetical protein